MISACLQKFRLYHLQFTPETETHLTRQQFTIFCHWWVWWVLAHMSYTCGLLLLYSTCFKDNCAFRHAFLYTLVVTSSYCSCCFLPLIFRQSGHSPLTFGTRHFYLEWLIYRPFSVNRRDVCVGKLQLPSRFCSRQTRSTTTNNKLQSPFFPILMDSLIFRMRLHA